MAEATSSASPAPSTLKRPADHLLRRFRIEAIGADTIGDYLAKGFSLAICCRDCPRLIEWTPPELYRRFGSSPRLRIADIARRLSCAGEEGCGSRDIAVFPHLFDGRWNPPA